MRRIRPLCLACFVASVYLGVSLPSAQIKREIVDAAPGGGAADSTGCFVCVTVVTPQGGFEKCAYPPCEAPFGQKGCTIEGGHCVLTGNSCTFTCTR